MTAQEFQLLRKCLEQVCGFVLKDDFKSLTDRRLGARFEFLGLPDFAAYIDHLRQQPSELETALEILMPHETYFFREPGQLRSFEMELLPCLQKQNEQSRTLRVWSAGCSTGEEPYTLAMILGGHPSLAGWTIDILGTDFSRKALDGARQAEYGATALRAASPLQEAQFFDRTSQGLLQPKERYRALVRFAQLNLLDAAMTGQLPNFDVIFCRNVLMYFEEANRRRVAELCFDHLEPGGYLLLGHAENLFHTTTGFEFVSLQGDLVYQRPRD